MDSSLVGDEFPMAHHRVNSDMNLPMLDSGSAVLPDFVDLFSAYHRRALSTLRMRDVMVHLQSVQRVSPAVFPGGEVPDQLILITF